MLLNINFNNVYLRYKTWLSMTKQLLSIAGVKVEIHGGLPLPSNPDVFAGWRSAPELGLSTTVRFIGSKSISSVAEGNDVVVRLPLAEFDKYDDTAWLTAIFAAQRVRQLNKHFLIHASSVVTPLGAFVFLGDSGAGKTLMALYLAGQLGCQIVSGDVTPLWLDKGRLYTFGHWCRVRIRPRTVMDLMSAVPMARDWLPEDIQEWSRKNRSSSWHSKLLVKPENLHITASNDVVPVRLLVNLRVLPFEPVYWDVSPARDMRLVFSQQLSTYFESAHQLIDNRDQLRGTPLPASEPKVLKARLDAAAAAGHVLTLRLIGRFEGVAGQLSTWIDQPSSLRLMEAKRFS